MQASAFGLWLGLGRLSLTQVLSGLSLTQVLSSKEAWDAMREPSTAEVAASKARLILTLTLTLRT